MPISVMITKFYCTINSWWWISNLISNLLNINLFFYLFVVVFVNVDSILLIQCFQVEIQLVFVFIDDDFYNDFNDWRQWQTVHLILTKYILMSKYILMRPSISWCDQVYVDDKVYVDVINNKMSCTSSWWERHSFIDWFEWMSFRWINAKQYIKTIQLVVYHFLLSFVVFNSIWFIWFPLSLHLTTSGI